MPESLSLKAKAAHCRHLAHVTSDRAMAATLTGMAEDYERQARAAVEIVHKRVFPNLG